MIEKAHAADLPGRFREIIGDPLNLLIRRVPEAGMVADGLVTLHNGNRVPIEGPEAYYGAFAEILRLNRGVHEPLEEFAFQRLLPLLPERPRMLELGAYWGHYTMWLLRERPAAEAILLEPDPRHLAVGKANLARNGFAATFLAAAVGPGEFELDRFLGADAAAQLDILHCDIQGHEAALLEGAARSLAQHRVGYLFVSTHSQALHLEVARRLAAFGYRLEASADFAHETTSYDGFLLAVAPQRPRVMPAERPPGRAEIARSSPSDLLQRLLRIAQG